MAAMCLYCGNLTEKKQNENSRNTYLVGGKPNKHHSHLNTDWRCACSTIINQILLSPQIQDISWTTVLMLFRLRVDSRLILDMLCFACCFNADTKHILDMPHHGSKLINSKLCFAFCFKTDTKHILDMLCFSFLLQN